MGPPVGTTPELVVMTSELTSVVDYQPDDLTLVVETGARVADVEAMLAERNQSAVLAEAPGDSTIGGMIASGASGYRRLRYGPTRDRILEATVATGDGRLVTAGARVVKNVTGYDLCKLLAGSYGTLAAMTDVTVKVLPAPEKTRTVLVLGLDEPQGLAAMTQGLASAHEVSGAAHLPANLILESEVSYVREAQASVTAVRVEGPAASVAYRLSEGPSEYEPIEEDLQHGCRNAGSTG